MKAIKSRTDTTLDTPSPDDTICCELSSASSAAARSLQLPALGFLSDALRDEPLLTVLREDAESEEATGRDRAKLLRGAKGFGLKIERWGEEEDGERDVAMARLLVCNFLSGCSETQEGRSGQDTASHGVFGPPESLGLRSKAKLGLSERGRTRTSPVPAVSRTHSHTRQS